MAMIEMIIQSFGAMLSPEAKENLEKAIKGLAEVPARLDRIEAKLDVVCNYASEEQLTKED